MPTKIRVIKANIFPVVMYGGESGKAEHWRIDAFELWCWRRLLIVPWTARRSNQSILFFFFLLFFFKFYFIFKLYNIVLVLPNIEMNPKGDQSWVFIGRTDAEAETPVLWSPDAKNWLTGKDPAAGKDWRQEEKGTTENEMAEWHHRLDGHEFEWTPGVGDGQGSLACCSSWGHTELYTTEWLNWTLTILPYMIFSILSSLKQSGN